MLAKLWKKVLLAICIIACLFNIMSKLVSKTSLELNLKSVENGESILSVFDEKEQETSSDIIEGVIEQDTNTNENAVKNTATEQTEVKNTTDFVVIY